MLSCYTLSLLENDRDVSAYSRGLEDAYYHARAYNMCFLTRSKEIPEIDAQMMRLAAYILWRGQ